MNKIFKVIWSKARNCYVVVSEIAKRNGKRSSSLNKKIISSFLAAGLITALPMNAEATAYINNQAISGSTGNATITTGVAATAWGNGKAQAWRATAFGQSTTASGQQSLAFGYYTQATADNATAWGSYAKATVGQATAFGGNTTASNWRATAFGQYTLASGSNSTAWGSYSTASKNQATAFGTSSTAAADQATAFGSNTNAGTVFKYNGQVVTPVRRVIERDVDGVVIQKEAWVLLDSNNNIIKTGQRFDGDYDAINNETYSLSYQALIDNLQKSAGGYEQRNATAFGESTIASGADSTAFGYRTAATAWNATAFGHETAATGKRATAFGIETSATGNNSTAFGYRTQATNENTTAWGSNTQATGIGATAFGSHTKSGGDNSVTWGKDSEVGSGELTYNGESYTDLSIQLVTEEIDDPNGSGQMVQIGHYYVQGRNANGELVTITEVDDNGEQWQWNYNGVTDQEQRENIKTWIKSHGGTLAGDYSTAFGNGSKVYAENALAALGGIVETNADNSAAIGKGARTTLPDSIALGSGSVANRAAGTDASGTTRSGYDANTGKASTEDTAIWRSTEAAIAVGDTANNITRQITGVAAGYEDTDAVNVAQLKQVQWNLGTDVFSTSPNEHGLTQGTVVRPLDVENTTIGNGTNKIKFIADTGLTLTSTNLSVDSTNDGYGIVISPDFQGLTATESGKLTGVYYKDSLYTIDNSSSPTVANVTTDYRSSYFRNESIEEGGNTVVYQKLFSPFFNVNGLPQNSTDEAIHESEWAIASGTDAIAIGRKAEARRENSLAIGYLAEAGSNDDNVNGANTVAIGFKAHSLANNAVSIGTATFATGNRGIAIGTSGTVDNLNGNPDYQRTWAAGQGSIVFGNEARAVTEAQRYSGKTDVDYDTNDAIAIGTRADARALNSIALGGNMSYTDSDGNVTFGKLTGNDRDFGATVGEGAKSAIAIGGAYGDNTGGTLNVEYEAAATYGAKSIAIGTGATIANTEDFLDLKNLVDDNSTGGYQDLRSKYYAARAAYTAAERDLRDYESANPGVHDAEYESLLTNFNHAKEVLFGTDSEKGAQQKFDEIVVKKIDLEKKNADSVADAIAIGAGAKTTIKGGIALGSNSTSGYMDRAGSDSKLTGYDEQTGLGYAGKDAASPAWRSTAASLSVGGMTKYTNAEGKEVEETITRRISNVAAGVFDTDVVNVAQLKRATNYDSDNRVTTIVHEKELEKDSALVIKAPFIETEGVKAMSDAMAITSYGDSGTYKNALKAESQNLGDRLSAFESQIESLETDLADLEVKKTKANSDEITKGYDNLIKEITKEKEELETRYKANKKLKENVDKRINTASDDFKNAKTLVDKQAKAYGEESITIGKGSVVGEADTAKGKQSVAVGTDITVTGDNSIGVGTGHKIYGSNSGAFGDPTEIDASVDGSYAIGNNSHITTSNTFILGNNVTTTYEDSVFLGSNSAYTEADNKTTAGIDGYGTDEQPVKINGTGYKFAGATPAGVVSVGGNVDGVLTTRRIQNVAAGLISAESTDAINGSQLYAAMQALSVEVIGDTDPNKKSSSVTRTPASTGSGGSGNGTGTEIKLTPATTFEVKASTTTINNKNGKSDSGNLIIKETNPTDDPKSYEYTIDLADNIKVNSVTAGNTTINNDGMTVGDTTVDNDGLTIKGGPSVKKDGMTVGDTTVDNDGLTIKGGPSVKKDGIDAGGKKITNVADATDDSDVVNYGQLKNYAAGNNEALNNLGNQIANVDNRATKGIAGAAALAALHPLDFDPDDKLTFAAGMGHYRGETAAAIGMFYRPDEKVMFSIGGTMGNGENMVNAGVSFSLDRTPRVTGSRTALTKEVVHLREQVAKQDAQIAELTALVRQLAGNAGVAMPAASALPKDMPAMFPDNLDNKWAYDKIEELEQQGYISGYAGCALTRNQFAAALDCALKGGATLDERLIKEFEPELSHVRVAHVDGKGNEDGKSYERPRFSYDKLEKHEIAKKHARVQVKQK